MQSFQEKQQILLEIISLLSNIVDLEGEGNLAHGLRVASLSQAIAKQLNHGKPSQLYVAGLLHDIGGISLEKHMLHYALDDFQDIDARNHSTRGAEILQSFHPFQSLVGWVADHHERYDGTGFPAGKSKHDISSEAGILHLADLLDIFLRGQEEATLREIRTFLNRQSASSVAPVIVEGARRLFSTPESLDLLKESDPKKRCGSIKEVYFPEINSIFVPELICQLLWLTAQVANCRTTKRVFHSNRVGFYCHRIAKAFHSPEVDPLQALWAGLLHDIGICSASEQELKKDPAILATTSLTYQQHPHISAKMVSTVQVLEHFAPILAAHHEYWNGTGFPAGLKGEDIPLLSQIINVCEHYDMLTTGKPQEDLENHHHYAISELEKGRDQLFSSKLLDIALPVFQIWGQRDISWMRDIKNVHAFFTSDPFDGIFQEQQQEPPQEQEPKKADSSFSPRQWESSELAADFTLRTGHNGLKAITAIDDIENFFDIMEPSIISETRQSLAALQDGDSLTLTLPSRHGKPLELIFLKRNDRYSLLYRGINETPLFTRKHSIFYQHFRNTPEAELILDKETVIKDVNDSALTLLGFPRQGLLGKGITALFSPFLSKTQLSSLHMLLLAEDEKIWIEEFSLINNKGTSFSIQVTIVPLPGLDDQDLAYLCRLRDISLRKELEQEMFHRDRAMQLIVHNISGMTGERFFKALLLQFATLTETSLLTIGELTDDNVNLQPIACREQNNFCNKEKFSAQNTPCNRVVQRGEIYIPDRLQELFPLDISLQQQDAHSCWGLPLRSQDGTIIGVLMAMDTKKILRSKSTLALVKVLQSLAGSELARMQTERTLKENKKQLESQNRELSRMNQLKSDMIAVTSHDLKSPLSAIIGYASLLEQYFSTLEEDKKIYYIKRIEEEGQKQLSFINKLLDLYRIESGTIDLELTPERLDLLANECIARQQHVAAERNITVELTIKGTPTPVLLDHLRMEQVISNILSNAIKFSPPDESINVCCSQNEENMMVEVCDRGKGIDEEEILHIFDRYYMGRTNFDIRPEGSGLGLYIVKNIITLHGGEVFARNRKKGGSCFTVQIPVKTNE
jgi:PAS domain S-box-containing protein/putative nucleotidyltransferase with HDIG domain